MEIELILSIASIVLASIALVMVYCYYRLLCKRMSIGYNRLLETIRVLHRGEREVLEKLSKLRRRYIVFTIISSESISRQEFEKALREKLSSLYGVIGLVKSDPQLVYYEPSLKRGVIRTSHLMKDYVVATLSLIKNVNGKKVLVVPVKTTGTIKRAKKILYKIPK